ncbi:hypothetical protein [Flavobacterium hungaricum]|uniref:Uncharacterized protein n=1 Tax=Flavobacterium hungaricum TaxID=2082725 RepID=A0ABR9TDU0_9FLAO|nr:hypothetical protein [Flavobacterium hungaricum]MBE8723538.1 hypothetical protein [Flavobacterium hungaricum]
MKFPDNPDIIQNEIYEAVAITDKVGDLRIRQLIQILSKVKHDLIIEGILKVFENENRLDSIYIDQKYAGMILKSIKPKTEENMEFLLNRVLKNWNKSIEELPFWFKDNYGIEKVKKAFSKVESTPLSEIELDKLKTMQWMLQIHSEA